MPDASTSSAPELTYALDYNVYSSAVYNHDFKSSGTLAISLAEPAYTFTRRLTPSATPSCKTAGRGGSRSSRAAP